MAVARVDSTTPAPAALTIQGAVPGETGASVRSIVRVITAKQQRAHEKRRRDEPEVVVEALARTHQVEAPSVGDHLRATFHADSSAISRLSLEGPNGPGRHAPVRRDQGRRNNSQIRRPWASAAPVPTRLPGAP